VINSLDPDSLHLDPQHHNVLIFSLIPSCFTSPPIPNSHAMIPLFPFYLYFFLPQYCTIPHNPAFLKLPQNIYFIYIPSLPPHYVLLKTNMASKSIICSHISEFLFRIQISTYTCHYYKTTVQMHPNSTCICTPLITQVPVPSFTQYSHRAFSSKCHYYHHTLGGWQSNVPIYSFLSFPHK
jgi:hypothetical protein